MLKELEKKLEIISKKNEKNEQNLKKREEELDAAVKVSKVTGSNDPLFLFTPTFSFRTYVLPLNVSFFTMRPKGITPQGYCLLHYGDTP